MIGRFFADVNDKLESQNFHVPLKRLKLRSRRPPWYKLDVHRCTNERNKLYKNWKSNTSAENWKLFRIARNKVHVVTKNAKNSTCHNSLVRIIGRN